jgi:hypothetical protein
MEFNDIKALIVVKTTRDFGQAAKALPNLLIK